ncbi:MAG: 16S rRNA (guanine(527)-N(7))-methyltransferase RsmG [Oscillospiraceae bacterium]|nr:16S rRNA (guanine(527)-N(7))-methyltransferase RsmG [Oscillospiraceae bacterium]
MQIIDVELLRQVLPELELSADAAERMELYAQRLLETNAHMNLTAITEPRGVTLKHFADSLSLLFVHEFPQSARVLDLGTGGGFPGVPLLFARPDLRVTFLDSTRKKLTFIERTLAEIYAQNNDGALFATPAQPRFIHARAEDAGKRGNPEYGAYDVVTARAVAALPALCGYALPFLRKGGTFLAMKGSAARDEAAGAEAALRKLGGKITDCVRISLPEDCGERWVIAIAV